MVTSPLARTSSHLSHSSSDGNMAAGEFNAFSRNNSGSFKRNGRRSSSRNRSSPYNSDIEADEWALASKEARMLAIKFKAYSRNNSRNNSRSNSRNNSDVEEDVE